MRSLVLAALVLLMASSASGQDPWTVADVRTMRLPPSRFPALPKPVQLALERRRCTIPQTPGNPRPHNVIRGHFRNARDWDWAALCSVNRRSRVVVFWGGQPDSIAVLEAAPDRDYLQGGGDNPIEFSRIIGVASPGAIRSYNAEFGGSQLPTIDHDGIEDAFEGKASAIAYYSQGHWLTFGGAD